MAKNFFTYLIIFAITILLVINLPTLASSPNFLLTKLTVENNLLVNNSPPDSQNYNGEKLLQESRELSQAGNFAEAARIAREAVRGFEAKGDLLGKAIALNLLSLAERELGNWSEAKNAINQSLEILHNPHNQKTNIYQSILAQNLNSLGQLQLTQGETETALNTWKEATQNYEQLGDNEGTIGSLLNQSLALQSLGLYKQELEVLTRIIEMLGKQPDSLLKVDVMRTLGNAFRRVGEIEKSQQILQQSLQISQQLKSPQAMAKSLIGLGNLARVNQNSQDAIKFYAEVANTTALPILQIQAKLNQFSLLIDELRLTSAKELWPQIQTEITKLPSSRATIYAKINFADSLIRLRQETTKGTPEWTAIAKLLAQAISEAKQLGDERAEAYAIGHLGTIYEVNKQLTEARDLTQKALQKALSLNAEDVAYRWEWQLGRILKIEGETKEAIAAYTEAVNTLQSLRSDLISINTSVQFSFRKTVEPVYRQLIDLLLESPANSQPEQANIQKALELMESLQLAELDNFFGDSCSKATTGAGTIAIDQIDPTAAVIYPIILDDRLEVILSIKGEPLQRYFTNINKGKLQSTVAQLRQALIEPRRSNRYNTDTLLPLSQQIYNWLIQPLETQLATKDIKTLVMVPDGVLRNIPLSVLYDGKQYLIEKYAIAINTGLRLSDPKPLTAEKLKVFSAGLTESRQGFNALPAVGQELKQIQSEIPTVVFLNQKFTTKAIQEELEFSYFPIVHLATHGEFSSTADKTFILTWDGRLNINQFQKILKQREQSGSQAIQLLVFSACQTAQGDDRAALGLAGMAVRSGARSTLATLWSVSDEATSAVMSEFYRQLASNKVSKSEAIRQAQLNLLKQEKFQHPLFWAAYILIGNWL